MTMGRLAPEEKYKGFDEVLDVFPDLKRTHPSVVYMIVGEGGDRPRLEAKTRQLGLQSDVIFAGKVPEAEKVAYFNTADAYVMPSSGEGFGIVLLEAAACGVPIVGSAVDGSREALLGGRLGRLVDPRSKQDLLSAIREALDRAGPKQRLADVETFGEDRFRERVENWFASEVGQSSSSRARRST